MNSFRNLVVAVCMAIPSWASYKLLPPDPDVTMIESKNPDVGMERPKISSTANQNSALTETARERELELLKSTVSQLNTEIDALKKQCYSASLAVSPVSL